MIDWLVMPLLLSLVEMDLFVYEYDGQRIEIAPTVKGHKLCLTFGMRSAVRLTAITERSPGSIETAEAIMVPPK